MAGKFLRNRGVRQVPGSYFKGETISVAAAGSVVNNAYFKQNLRKNEAAAARFLAWSGALLTGYRSLDIPLAGEPLDNLRRLIPRLPVVIDG
ncbi:hypothetical protein [Paenibacillus chitinolyticus]|uniref:hypothetical protein n=1 Tax=Paenibacillus chitinolyticus TaxID=79263 RepID=UPI003649F80E